MTRKITFFGIFTASMLVGGYMLYFMSKLMPIPGSKFIIMGSYLTFVMSLPLIRYPNYGTLTLINLVLGGIMFVVSPWMMLAIVLAGIVADFIMLLPIGLKSKQVLAMGVYNGVSLLTSIYISNYVTGNVLYKLLNFQGTLVIVALSVFTGMIGGYMGIKVNKKYLKLGKSLV